jgi:predicted CoA-binding protein
MSMMERIRDYLGRRRVAVVGVSSNGQDFSRAVYREFKKLGYDTVPVNPQAEEIESDRCFKRVQDIQPPPEWALLYTRPEVSEQIVRDCAEAGVRRIWFHRSVAQGSLNGRALALCSELNIEAVPGECPMMFLENAGWFHRFHGFLKQLTGSYPR